MPTELPPHSPDLERMQAQLPREEVVSPPQEIYQEMPEPGRSPTFQHFVDVSYMVVTALVLFFAPLLNGFLGGVAGGFRAGTFRRALPAAIAASVAVPAMLWALYSFPGAGLHRFFSGLGFEGFAILNAVGLLLGAVTGVLCNPRSEAHLPRFLRFHDYEAPSALREDMMMHPVHHGVAAPREAVEREGMAGPMDRTAPRRRWLRRP
jgi:hypothetical protein